MFCLVSQASQDFATAVTVTVVATEPQNKQYSSWVKRVRKQGRGTLLQRSSNWYTNRWQSNNLLLYSIPNVFLLFLFLSFKVTQTNSKPCNISSYSPALTQIYSAHTSPLTWFNAFFRSHRAHSSGVSVCHPSSCHTWEPLTELEQCPVCTKPLHITWQMKTSFHWYPLGGLVKYLHRQNLLFQYWDTDLTIKLSTATSGKAQRQLNQELTCPTVRSEVCLHKKSAQKQYDWGCRGKKEKS